MGLQRDLFSGEIIDRKLRRKDPRLTSWAVAEVRDPVIWGVGMTQHDAVVDAMNQLKAQELFGIENVVDMADEIQSGFLQVVPCTRRLADEVHDYGGEVEYVGIKDAGLFLPGEIKGGKP